MKQETSKITVQTKIPLSKDEVWDLWTKPEHIKNWNHASEEWHCPAAVNNLKEGGEFSWRMEAKNGSMGFDFSGVYVAVSPKERIVQKLDDGRKVEIEFQEIETGILVIETFEPENLNSRELQQEGWQAILDNFKKYALNRK